MWVIFIFCLISIFFDLFLTYSIWAVEHKYFIWNLFSIVEYAFITYFFYIIIKHRFIRILILGFSLFYLLYFLLNSKTDNNQFNSELSAIESVVILTLSLSYFMIIMRPTSEPVNIFTPVFLIVVGLLLFVSSTLFLFIIANRLSEKEMNQYWSINYYANILVSFIFSAAFLLFFFQQKSKPLESQSVDYTSPNDR